MAEKVELNTERMLLRPFRLEDVDDIYSYAKDPEYGRYQRIRPYTRRSAEEFIAKELLASWSTHPAFAIVLSSVVVGGISLHVEETDEIAELGYDLARVLWGKGLVAEAAKAVIDWGFMEYSLAKIYATADLRNQRSWRVMEKLDMTREGVLQSHRDHRGERVDEVQYGILREEWKRGQHE